MFLKFELLTDLVLMTTMKQISEMSKVSHLMISLTCQKKLCQKYHNFFNIWNADQLTSHQIIDHVIDFKSNTEFLYICMYNMFSAELKTLNNYFNNILVKKWIHKFQNFADIFIFFIFWKSEKLHFCINYHELNIIIIKNCYFLSLISKLLDWLSSSTVFSKIDL